jgi:hypothetical protein
MSLPSSYHLKGVHIKVRIKQKFCVYIYLQEIYFFYQ